ncbi:DUF4269 domain-containing protein [Bacillus salacetis]|uniref:DUF4269 domain-containing protein n=1 Tax=Bacillus salacetis TaxID=2315464 RepID=UPI0023E76B21|nr:DUF4269 domain-containing protein [Bacillus salacetis]
MEVDFDFELFGQMVPVRKQNAWLHMIIEHEIQQRYPNLKEEVMDLKNDGLKTEPAFC